MQLPWVDVVLPLECRDDVGWVIARGDALPDRGADFIETEVQAALHVENHGFTTDDREPDVLRDFDPLILTTPDLHDSPHFGYEGASAPVTPAPTSCVATISCKRTRRPYSSHCRSSSA